MCGRMRSDDVGQVKTSLSDSSPVRAREKTYAFEITWGQLNFEPFGVGRKLTPHCSPAQEQQSLAQQSSLELFRFGF